MLCEAEGKVATAIIAGGHTTFIYIARGEEILFSKQPVGTEEQDEQNLDLNLKKEYEKRHYHPLSDVHTVHEVPFPKHARIGSQSMNETDRVVLDIMTHKRC